MARFLIWRFGKFGKDHQIKNSPIYINACTPMVLHIQITKFKFRQYQLRALSAKNNACQSYPLYRTCILTLSLGFLIFSMCACELDVPQILKFSCYETFCTLKVTIICRYIFLRFELKTRFVSTKFCNFYAEMVQGRQILMLCTTVLQIANVCGYKFLRFWANPQKYQILVPAKFSYLKV